MAHSVDGINDCGRRHSLYGAVCLFGYDGEKIGKGLRLGGKGIYFFVGFVSVQRDGNFEIFIHSVPFFASAGERPRRLMF